ncbi:hypothetical protein SBA5_90024 [Candidatus Sulfotelmatomonas gaucii]|uniref:Uncharacterized protein n=1 Tax=Candidatus Sulfuritelmatomonas gaucii TaxID=2043161 RepID=A0A2N9M8A9_9BACT|nr:hypothetical protein SBA5_90024 [Candidatus Sulfotelmatomonas gaucii]
MPRRDCSGERPPHRRVPALHTQPPARKSLRDRSCAMPLSTWSLRASHGTPQCILAATNHGRNGVETHPILEDEISFQQNAQDQFKEGILPFLFDLEAARAATCRAASAQSQSRASCHRIRFGNSFPRKFVAHY